MVFVLGEVFLPLDRFVGGSMGRKHTCDVGVDACATRSRRRIAVMHAHGSDVVCRGEVAEVQYVCTLLLPTTRTNRGARQGQVVHKPLADRKRSYVDIEESTPLCTPTDY